MAATVAPPECVCTADGLCPFSGLYMNGHLRKLCRTNAKYREKFAEVPSSLPPQPSPRIKTPCTYRGEVLREESGRAKRRTCNSCPKLQELAPTNYLVFACKCEARGKPDCTVPECVNCDFYVKAENYLARFDERNLAPQLPGKRFNSSLIAWHDGYLLAFRDGWRGSEIHVARLNRDLQPCGDSVKLNLWHEEANYGREDPRLFLFRGQLHVAYIGVTGGKRIRHTSQLYARLNNDTLQAENVFFPRYKARNLWEKNWQFFEHEGQLYASYSIAPHRVLRIDDEQTELAYETPTAVPWSGGELRGGAAPVLVRGSKPGIRRVVVRRRDQVNHVAPSEPYVVVSVYDFAGKPAEINRRGNCLGVLYLRFQDFDPVSRQYAVGETYQKVPIAEQWMQQAHAAELWRFLKEHGEAACLVVHCNEGVSRSPAIAMAITDALGLERACIDWSNAFGRRDPGQAVTNGHVYQSVMAQKPAHWPCDEFWCFVHSKVTRNGLLVYNTGLVTFSAKPPFAVSGIIPEPILWADVPTKPGDQYAAVVFACGAVRRGKDWIVSHGIHDRWTELHAFNHAELQSRLVEVPSP